ncbi:UDP-N-acetylmuramate dehydrogenase [Diaminobutyricimonas aerilata]|uniref:UDP-N-acetylenolpyruvoylglucosamine reductase n=1 Tax=Diaminobutyricimonas aerilata TaxID=1162967 RepID=A0A2M9CGF7_9MICO|nr:UDP-N-acetylmuramate dehydrogenase [Diaminobutyricimonas aerilata]PJJ70968.1 UDP-N-acetylmuramate dehydrogenase [Diaminobutyricimonas aerilata]
MRFSELTTLRVGGDAAEVIEVTDAADLVQRARELWGRGDEVLVLGGGSNLLVGDDGFDGTVLRVATRGIREIDGAAPGRVRLRVEAGESWDGFVRHTVERGLGGVEALSGIPGSVGASPVQNIGAYGQEVAATLVAIEFLDYLTGEQSRMPAAELDLGYRTSVLKRGRQGIVLAVEFDLERDADGAVGYPQLARALGVEVGDRVPLATVRDTVLALRRSKGMVLDDADPDTWSAGSFFTNPIVRENFARGLPADAPRWPIGPEQPDVAVPLGEQPAAPAPPVEGSVKLSAAWLIEHAGVSRGFRLPGSRAAISSKHTLALTNTGGATAEEIAALARYVRMRVLSEFGVLLHPEPVVIGLDL